MWVGKTQWNIHHNILLRLICNLFSLEKDGREVLEKGSHIWQIKMQVTLNYSNDKEKEPKLSWGKPA